MGFMDKAKKLAEQAAVQGKTLADQAQTKIDQVQNDFNEKQTANQQQGGTVTEFDKHGRPVGESESAPVAPSTAPTPSEAEFASDGGDPLAATPEPAASAPPPAPAPPAAPPTPPAAGGGMTSGDPLAG